MKRIVFGIITLLTISCNEKTQEEFLLSGLTKGFEDGTTLYLDYKNELMDSAKVENNSFELNSKLPKSPIQVVLRTKDYSNYRFLWLENKPMTFDASNSDFRNAIVTGSEPEKLSYQLSQETDSLSRPKRMEKEKEFVEKHPNSVVSANILSIYSTTWGKETTQELFDNFSKENKNTEYGEKIQRYIELNKEPKIGEKFADFEMANQNGILKKLSDVKGKVILLEFWASWCGPCRQENPNLVKTYEKYNPKGFEIFAVSLDEKKESWIKAIEKDSLNWGHVSDLKGQGNEASLIYGVNGIPDNFLIAENGDIIGRNLRGEKLNKKLKEVLE